MLETTNPWLWAILATLLVTAIVRVQLGKRPRTCLGQATLYTPEHQVLGRYQDGLVTLYHQGQDKEVGRVTMSGQGLNRRLLVFGSGNCLMGTVYRHGLSTAGQQLGQIRGTDITLHDAPATFSVGQGEIPELAATVVFFVDITSALNEIPALLRHINALPLPVPAK